MPHHRGLDGLLIRERSSGARLGPFYSPAISVSLGISRALTPKAFANSSPVRGRRPGPALVNASASSLRSGGFLTGRQCERNVAVIRDDVLACCRLELRWSTAQHRRDFGRRDPNCSDRLVAFQNGAAAAGHPDVHAATIRYGEKRRTGDRRLYLPVLARIFAVQDATLIPGYHHVIAVCDGNPKEI